MEEKKITMADVEAAFDRFVKGTDRAEQHDFIKIMIVHHQIDCWINHLRIVWDEDLAQKVIKFIDDAIKYFGW